MPAQIGYFDTLKSVAGKVFIYLASITITGTDGKTLTVEDNSLVNQDLTTDASATHANLALTGGPVVDPVERIVNVQGTAFATVLTITSNNASYAGVLVNVLAIDTGTPSAGGIQYSGRIANSNTAAVLATTTTGTDMTALFQWVLAANAGTMVLQAKASGATDWIKSRIMVMVRSTGADNLPTITW